MQGLQLTILPNTQEMLRKDVCIPLSGNKEEEVEEESLVA